MILKKRSMSKGKGGLIPIQEYFRLKEDKWLNFLEKSGFHFDEHSIVANSRCADKESRGYGMFIRQTIN